MNSRDRANHLTSRGILRGDKVSLRLPRVDELPFIRKLWGDPDTMAAVGGPVELSEANARAWFARMVEPGGPSDCYCLVFNQDGVPVGEISFHHWDPDERSAVLNVKILGTYRARGHAKDALLTFLKFFFGRVDGRLMTDDVALDNRAGQRLLQSIGFEKDPRVSNVCRMSMSRQTFLELYREPIQTIRPTADSGA